MNSSKIFGGLIGAALIAGAVTAAWKIAASRRSAPPSAVESPADRAAREAAAVEEELLAFPAKLTRFLKADAAQRGEMRAELLEAISSRHAHLCRLAATDPARVATHALRLGEAEDLPADLRDQLERFASLRAEIAGVQPASPAGATPMVYQVQVKLPGDDEIRSGYSWGDTWPALSGRMVPVQVWLLGETAVIEAGFVHPLTTAECAALQGKYELANPEADRCFETGERILGAPTAALSGGKLFYFCDDAAAEAFGRKLRDLELHRIAQPAASSD